MHALIARSDTALVTAGRQLRIAALVCVLFAGLFVLLSRNARFAFATWLLLPAAFVLLIGAALLVLTSRRYAVPHASAGNR